VLGLVGSNGIGKSTALKILSGKLKPNLGRYDDPPDWTDVIKYFRGSELQSRTIPSKLFFDLTLSFRLLHEDSGG
jgi:translation initiation factor RLI1